jgi:hypothetical protein
MDRPPQDRRTTDGLARRDVLGGAALLALVLGLPAVASAALPPRRLMLMRQICGLVIPRSDTAGAGEGGVAEFVLLAADHGLEGAAPDHIAWLETALDQAAGGDFTAQPAARQADLLAALDRAAFAAATSPWRPIKALILTGYYTSETGASHELHYELVPGRFDPDLPLHPGDRAWSSDWTAVDFG